MIRKGILVSLTIGGLLVALAWTTSFYSYDDELDRLSRLHSILFHANDRRSCYYVTSLHGWLRFGTVSVYGSPPLDDLDGWATLGSRRIDMSLVLGGFATAHLGGLVVVTRFSFDSTSMAGFSAPHWFISLLLLTYPAIRFIRGPLRRRRRRKRGLCTQCGYNLTGNTSGVCPECAAKVEG